MLRLAQTEKLPLFWDLTKDHQLEWKANCFLLKSVSACKKRGEGRNAFLKMGCDNKYLSDGTLGKTFCCFSSRLMFIGFLIKKLAS